MLLYLILSLETDIVKIVCHFFYLNVHWNVPFTSDRQDVARCRGSDDRAWQRKPSRAQWRLRKGQEDHADPAIPGQQMQEPDLQNAQGKEREEQIGQKEQEDELLGGQEEVRDHGHGDSHAAANSH